MKTLLIAINLFLSLHSSFGMDVSVLEKNYPGFHDYEATALSGVKNYFRNLMSKCIEYSSSDDSVYAISCVNPTTGVETIFKTAVERKMNSNSIEEVVNYRLQNGNAFTYSLTRRGKNLLPTNDRDLLMFKFRTKDLFDEYELSVPLFQIDFFRKQEEKTEKSYFVFKAMDLSVGINTLSESYQIVRDYIYFYTQINPPEQVLTVKAVPITGDWEGYEYTHFHGNIGLISPKLFFKGLNDGSGIFEAASAMFLSQLYQIGFPTF